MTTPSYENAAALLRRQQSTTARLRAGLPALLVHLEHTEVLPPEPRDPVGGPTGDPAGHPADGTETAAGDPIDDGAESRAVDPEGDPDPPAGPRTWF